MFLWTADDEQQAAKNYTMVQGQEKVIEQVDMMGLYTKDLDQCS